MTPYIRNIFFYLLILIVALEANAGVSETLDSAANAYNDGQYAEAAALYESVAKQSGVSAELYANMGNSYAKAGDYGHAFLCYERSLYLNPSDKEVRNNRAYILSKIEDGNKANAKGKKISVVEDAPSFFMRLKHYVTHSHTSNTWAVWGGISFILLCGCVALYIFSKEVLARKAGFFGGIVLLIGCTIFMTFSFASAKACDTHNQGIITGFKVTLLSEPYSSAKTSGTPLERGTRLYILDTDEDKDGNIKWYKVRLNSEFAGWIPADEFEVI